MFCRRRCGMEVFGRAGGDQELMVQIRAAECCHEEIVTQGKLAGNLPQVEIFARLAIVAHDHAARVAPGDETIIFAVVNLHLVLVKQMPQVTRDDAFGQGVAIAVAQLEGAVRQVSNLVFFDLIVLAADVLQGRYQAAPDPRQRRQGRAVAVFLH